LTVTGNGSNVSSSQDLLSGEFAIHYGASGGTAITGMVQTTGGFQSGVYVDNAASATFDGIRGFVQHFANSSADTISLFQGLQFVITTNVGTITNTRFVSVPDVTTVSGGGSFTNVWSLFSSGTTTKLYNSGPINSDTALNFSDTGSASSPLISLASGIPNYSSNSGVFSDASGDFYLTVGGTQKLEQSTSALTVSTPVVGQGNSGATNPTFAFADGTGTGIFDSSAGSTIEFAVGGTAYYGVNQYQIYDAHDSTGWELTNNSGSSRIIPNRGDSNAFVGALTAGDVDIDADSSGPLRILNIHSTGVSVVAGGFKIGSPTGGIEGAGTLNVQGGIYANGTQGITGSTCTAWTNGLCTHL
ncbi:MAG TPA: hypothetical protein VMD53_03885, partial [Rhizomicrobium sp.]|nr:hypothetical protein [Rhizomicrobium sp.]